MSGIIGGRLEANELRRAIAEGSRASERTWRYESENAGLGAHYAEQSAPGLICWDDGSRGGVVYGAITNRDELDLSDSVLFDRLLDRPADTAAALEGGFFIACYDADDDRFLLVSDKLGSRMCYFIPSDKGVFRFATAVAPLVSRVDDPTLDLHAVSDMLLMGHMWGDHTLVREVRAMRPATILDVTDGDRSAKRYWKPSYDEAPASEAYLVELVDRYRQAVRRSSRTLPREAGIWLSGGLDSRTTAGALLANADSPVFETLSAYTYDANPPTNDNPRIANEVANRLGITLHEVPLTADRFGDVFERVIEGTDGMIRWNTTLNLSAIYNLDSVPPVMMEGMQGELVGDHPFRHHLTRFNSAVEAQYSTESGASVETVRELLTPKVDPKATFKEEAARSPESSHRKRVLDIHFQNYYSRNTLASDRLVRDRVDTRAPQVDGDYLEWCSKLPMAFRKGAFPLNVGDGGIPYGTSRAKLELTRRLTPTLADITYERTKVKPSWPYPAHIVGFLGNVATGHLRSKPTYGSGQLADWWIRDESTALHGYVRKLVDDAASRQLFDGDAVRSVFAGHMDGKNNAPMLAQITTLEYWIQNHID